METTVSCADRNEGYEAYYKLNKLTEANLCV